jgi:glucose-6-phosphate isomerase
MKHNQLELLQQHLKSIESQHLKELFANDSNRFDCFSLEAAGLFLDYSKNRITSETMQLLINFANSANLSQHIEDMFSGLPINFTEKRSVLHTALRNPTPTALWVDGLNITHEIHQCLQLMERWIEELTNGKWVGFSGKAFTDVVHIGIGGSHLGPLLASQALQKYQTQRFNCHYVSSVDHDQLEELLAHLNQETTLFIVASKSFSTQETAANAEYAKKWLQLKTKDTSKLASHFIATTANIEKATQAGFSENFILPLWDWVGGRYSLWSSVGLPVALSIGMNNFKDLLKGAYAMDQHFLKTPFDKNMPVILGLIGFWNIQFLKMETQAVLPYDFQLRTLPRYLQQLDMESNGKRMRKDNRAVDYATAPVTFGESGTESQHSFHQLLFQGTHKIPCDFIATLKNQPLLLANCLAQSRALMNGKTAEEVKIELTEKGYHGTELETLVLHKTIPGNQTSNTILLSKLSPETLGALIAMYEHKTFVQGVLWNINSFDQWGVELGKEIAKSVLHSMVNKEQVSDFDASTKGLLNYLWTKS